MNVVRILVVFSLLTLSFGALSQEDPFEADREELLRMLSAIETGLSEQDIDAVLTNFDEQVVVTYLNAEVTTDHAGIRAYFERMMEGDNPVVTSYSTDADVSAPAVFHGDTAVAHGTTDELYELANGLSFDIRTNWSTTLVKEDGEWRVVALHFSNNLFDNPMVNTANRLGLVYGGVGAVAGLILGFLLFRRKPA